MEEKLKPVYGKIADKINRMGEVDQAMRVGYQNGEREWNDSIDQENTKQMMEIIDEIGWPTISKVGQKASGNAWLLAQHADHDITFQKECLTLMKGESTNEVDPSNIAYLTDRIAVAEGKPQIYGTQFDQTPDGKFKPHPIKNPEQVNQRRLEMGMTSLEENIQLMHKIYGS